MRKKPYHRTYVRIRYRSRIITLRLRRHKIGKPKEKAVSAGVIRTSPNEVTSVRLFEIRNEFRKLISEYRPEVVAIERVRFQRNVKTAVSVSQVIGVIMVEALDANCEVAEYSPTEVKLAVAGYGGAQKAEIQTMVQLLLGIEKKLEPVDAADALAVALCYSANRSMVAR